MPLLYGILICNDFAKGGILMLKKRILAALSALIITVGLLTAAAIPVSAEGYPLPEDTKLYASAAILVNLTGNAEGDVVLYQKNADEVHAPGSMMRYAVLAYALQRIREEDMNIDKVTGKYTQDLFNRYVAGTGVPTANMNFGEQWTLRDLLAVSFIQSASDTVAVLAEAIDGSVPAFVEGMNKMAADIGCEYTHFANLTGLDSLGQYTTARDMYRIMRYCQSFSEFEETASRYQVTVSPKSGGDRTYVSNNSLLQSSSIHHYSAIAHSRTGLSEHEGRTCASVARDQGYEYLVVVMGCPEQNKNGETGLHYRDTKTLFQWAFNYFEHQTVLGKSEIIATLPLELAWDTDHINLVPADKVATVVDKNLDLTQIIRKVTLYEESVQAPVEKGQVLGQVELIVNTDQTIGRVDLVAGETIERSSVMWILHKVGGVFTSGWFWLAVGALVLLIVLYVVYAIMHNRRRRQQRLSRGKRL